MLFSGHTVFSLCIGQSAALTTYMWDKTPPIPSLLASVLAYPYPNQHLSLLELGLNATMTSIVVG